MPDAFDYRRLRGILAENRVTQKQFAAACGLHPTFVSRVLTGHPAGELARMKIDRGIRALGLNSQEVRRAG